MLYNWLQPYFEQFVNTLLQGRLSSSIIIAGHEGLGGNILALELARFYLCHEPSNTGACGHCRSCQAFSRLIHPDLKVAYSSNSTEASDDLDFTGNLMGLLHREESKTRRSLRVDTMRQISEFLTQTSVLGGRGKVVIIESAQLMSEGAANAILKTFEEPNDHTLIIMLASSLESLLPTILSRASKIVLHEVSLEQSLAYLSNQQLSQSWLSEHLNKINSEAVAAIAKSDTPPAPLTQARVEIALALNSYAPLAAQRMLQTEDDLKALEVVQALVQYVQSIDRYNNNNNDYGAGVIATLDKLSKPLQLRLLDELILEVIKYKAYVSENELPLIHYANAVILQCLPLDHLFDARDKLRFIEDRSPLIPARAPISLIRAWLEALCTLPASLRHP